jgi:hypothetical protein
MLKLQIANKARPAPDEDMALRAARKRVAELDEQLSRAVQQIDILTVQLEDAYNAEAPAATIRNLKVDRMAAVEARDALIQDLQVARGAEARALAAAGKAVVRDHAEAAQKAAQAGAAVGGRMEELSRQLHAAWQEWEEADRAYRAAWVNMRRASERYGTPAPDVPSAGVLAGLINPDSFGGSYLLPDLKKLSGAVELLDAARARHSGAAQPDTTDCRSYGAFSGVF